MPWYNGNVPLAEGGIEAGVPQILTADQFRLFVDWSKSLVNGSGPSTYAEAGFIGGDLNGAIKAAAYLDYVAAGGEDLLRPVESTADLRHQGRTPLQYRFLR